MLIHDLSLQTRKAKSASMLENQTYGERERGGDWQDLKGYEVQDEFR